jgi:serine/threonine protein kinase
VKKIQIDQEHVLAMKRDFITLRELHHPSICRYKALYFENDQRTAYLVMEYIQLPSLDKVRIQNEDELRTIVREVLEAIDYLHRRNVCHRDIKPENILYNRDTKKVKLIDFGISKKTFLRGQRRDMLTIIGTHLFMAPEIYLGGGYDERVDLWALGVTIYKLVTGVTPFESEYHSDTVAAICRGIPSFEQEKWEGYSPSLVSFVSLLLKRAEDRMAVSQAERHLWLQTSTPEKRIRLRKLSSYSIIVHEDFHEEFNNKVKHANSKEEGCKDEIRPIFKNIKNLGNKNF